MVEVVFSLVGFSLPSVVAVQPLTLPKHELEGDFCLVDLVVEGCYLV